VISKEKKNVVVQTDTVRKKGPVNIVFLCTCSCRKIDYRWKIDVNFIL